MKASLVRKTFICLLLAVMTILLLQNCVFAKSEDVQMLKKGEKEYLIYISDLLNEKFEFAFSNKADEVESNLAFADSAVDSAENGNNIAYIDETIYNSYFEGKTETFLWVKQNTEYKVKAEKVTLTDALLESDIESLNNVTKVIPVKFGELNLPTETVDGVKVTRKMGTINIENNEQTTYSYKMVKVEKDSAEASFIKSVEKMNEVDSKDMFTKLATYSEFKEIYTKLQPAISDKEWKDVEENVIKQPTTSKNGEQYLVWIKAENQDQTTTDVQIMTCNDEYTPQYETKEVVKKTTTKTPVTGESLTLYVIAAILVVLIALVIVLKIKNNKKNNNA
ncbi:MAG: hypothetical protein ACI4UU_02445 [Clostridia bacterium]